MTSRAPLAMRTPLARKAIADKRRLRRLSGLKLGAFGAQCNPLSAERRKGAQGGGGHGPMAPLKYAPGQ